MNDLQSAVTTVPEHASTSDRNRLAGRLVVFILAGAAIGALVGTMAGIAPFAALVGAPLGMAGAVLAGD